MTFTTNFFLIQQKFIEQDNEIEKKMKFEIQLSI